MKEDNSTPEFSDSETKPGEEFTHVDDQRLRAALYHGGPASDLRERILMRLRQESDQPAMQSRVFAHEPLDTLTAASLSVRPLPSPRNRRFYQPRYFVAVVVAASLAGMLFGWYQLSRPLPTERLAAQCLSQLDRLLSSETHWQTSFDAHREDLHVLDGQLRSNVQPLGYQEIPGEAFSKSCRVWQFHSHVTRQRFYVLDFHSARKVQKLNSQLQVIKQVSGGWSLVAMRSGERLVVVAFSGAPGDYLNRRAAA